MKSTILKKPTRLDVLVQLVMMCFKFQGIEMFFSLKEKVIEV